MATFPDAKFFHLSPLWDQTLFRLQSGKQFFLTVTQQTMCKKQMRKCRSLDAYEDEKDVEGSDDVIKENEIRGGSSSSSFLLQDSGDELENDPLVN